LLCRNSKAYEDKKKEQKRKKIKKIKKEKRAPKPNSIPFSYLSMFSQGAAVHGTLSMAPLFARLPNLLRLQCRFRSYKRGAAYGGVQMQLAVILGVVVWRLLWSFVCQTYFVADEYFQTSEVAYHWIYGKVRLFQHCMYSLLTSCKTRAN
jgi:hypothetical protein